MYCPWGRVTEGPKLWQDDSRFKTLTHRVLKSGFFLPVALGIWQDFLLGIYLSLSVLLSLLHTHCTFIFSQCDFKIWILSLLPILIFSLHASNK